MTRESFEIAVTEKLDPREEPYTFHFSDDPERDLVVFPPTENQIMLLMSLGARGPDNLSLTEMGRVYNLLASLLDEDSRRYVERRMEENTLSYSALFPIMTKLIELESGRPTEPSSGSSSPPSKTGNRSAGPARRATSTRSKAPARRSATTSTPGSSNRSASTAKAANG